MQNPVICGDGTQFFDVNTRVDHTHVLVAEKPRMRVIKEISCPSAREDNDVCKPGSISLNVRCNSSYWCSLKCWMIKQHLTDPAPLGVDGKQEWEPTAESESTHIAGNKIVGIQNHSILVGH
jgi:hypothetical protein